ncbi:SDR family oxidoreductase [Mucilaginibacter aquatilis]|uniref:SDR family NAD(P)-dependent oxidoreductase n=1 Tax=Mucilaginibacter aquatilis TaxID=1517760 RepID=A0A6I4IA91_9SPHI|nr:SDR family oxidoreductase [Mucilaginibacter aquatilis]MVN90888.1 SDR family NAD(P)-dependent oxidoreductase [Mucilaginibacter aquatilis]
MENALITGATQGIGRAIALAFAKQGISMAICSRNVKDLQNLQIELLKMNSEIQVHTQVADCSKRTDVRAFAQAAQDKLGFINILVNNVGAFIPSTVLNDDDNAFDTLFNTNVMPAYELYRFFGKQMQQEGKGHIFNICSAASKSPAINAGTYSVTKAALYSLNTVMKLEMQAYKVKVTAVLPGSTLTGSWAGTEVHPSRFVMPEDVAAAVLTAYNMSVGANTDEIVIKPVSGQI